MFLQLNNNVTVTKVLPAIQWQFDNTLRCSCSWVATWKYLDVFLQLIEKLTIPWDVPEVWYQCYNTLRCSWSWISMLQYVLIFLQLSDILTIPSDFPAVEYQYYNTLSSSCSPSGRRDFNKRPAGIRKCVRMLEFLLSFLWSGRYIYFNLFTNFCGNAPYPPIPHF
jgi:hypothetical protein